jgi:hypothetical protein
VARRDLVGFMSDLSRLPWPKSQDRGRQKVRGATNVGLASNDGVAGGDGRGEVMERGRVDLHRVQWMFGWFNPMNHLI